MFFFLLLQTDLVCTSVIDTDSELFSRVGSVFVFIVTSIVVIVKIQTTNVVHTCVCHVGIQRNEVMDSALDEGKLSGCTNKFQFVTIFFVFYFFIEYPKLASYSNLQNFLNYTMLYPKTQDVPKHNLIILHWNLHEFLPANALCLFQWLRNHEVHGLVP